MNNDRLVHILRDLEITLAKLNGEICEINHDKAMSLVQAAQQYSNSLKEFFSEAWESGYHTGLKDAYRMIENECERLRRRGVNVNR